MIYILHIYILFIGTYIYIINIYINIKYKYNLIFKYNIMKYK